MGLAILGGYVLGMRTRAFTLFRFRSSAVEQTTVNRSVPGSIPGETAIFGRIAQSVEQVIEDHRVGSSTLSFPTIVLRKIGRAWFIAPLC